MRVYNFFITPFIVHPALRDALWAILYESFSVAPIGVFLMMRRMTLMGDALSHAVLPGVAIGFLLAGYENSLWMSVGGLLTGLIVMIAASWATQKTRLKEDANFTGFYLFSLALGVLIISFYGGDEEIVHVLFGSLSSVKRSSLLLLAIISTVTLLGLATLYRPLYLESAFPSLFFPRNSKKGFILLFFQIMVVFNLIGSFQTLGTLLGVGLIMIPAISASLWVSRAGHLIALSWAIAIISSFFGLVFSYHLRIDSGALIITLCGLFYLLYLLIAPHAVLGKRMGRKKRGLKTV